MKCYKCGEAKGVYRGKCTGNKLFCSPCYDEARKVYELSPREGYARYIGQATDFQPYKLTDGNLKRVEDHENFDHNKRGIWIESLRQEKEVLNKMGNRLAERGDNLLGHKFGHDGADEHSEWREYKETEKQIQAFHERTRADMATVGLEKDDLKELTKGE